VLLLSLFFTDLSTICFFRYVKSQNGAPAIAYNTGCLPLIISPKPPAPTEGFSNLVRILLAPPLSLGSRMSFKAAATIGTEEIRLGEFLGSGATSEVYKTMFHGQEFAAKIKSPSAPTDFTQEIAILQRLNNEHIIQLFPASTRELLLLPQGTPLLDLVNNNAGRLAIGPASRFVQGIFRALCYAHSQGVVHRDIRPTNIILFRDEPLLIAWGLADRIPCQQKLLVGRPKFNLTRLVRLDITKTILRSGVNRATWTFEQRDDLEALAITFVAITAGTVPKGHSSSEVIAAQKKYWEETKDSTEKADLFWKKARELESTTDEERRALWEILTR